MIWQKSVKTHGSSLKSYQMDNAIIDEIYLSTLFLSLKIIIL